MGLRKNKRQHRQCHHKRTGLYDGEKNPEEVAEEKVINEIKII
jgi:hypothetical protein